VTIAGSADLVGRPRKQVHHPMADRLSPLDVSFLYMETPTTAMHVGGVAIFAPPDDGFDYDRLVELITERISMVPRYRQKVRFIPGRLANPVWVDDEDFDVTYHVRRSALPKPGTDAQLRELAGRLMSRQLDRSRPLWEIYLVEGLQDGRTGIITKTHHAMVDGVSAVDISTVILDATPEPRETGPDSWRPRKEPGAPWLVAEAVLDFYKRPTQAADAARIAALDARATATRVAEVTSGVLSSVRSIARPAPESPLNVRIGEQRRFGMARTDLEDYRRVRTAHGGTVNDVVLATVAGALRTWMLTRGESVTPATTIRAMVPVSVRGEAQTGQLGNRVSSYFVDLPVGEGNPVVRLHQVSFAMRGHKESGQSIGADALVSLSGFAPPTLHSLGARAASSFTRRLFNLVVTNVPGPQFPLYAASARMLEMYPVVPLSKGQAVSIGLTSYDGGVYYGLNADRDAMPDIDVLASCLEESLAELVGTVDQ
jgi:diacylglycerol O-acyltransferase / wax synthase